MLLDPPEGWILVSNLYLRDLVYRRLLEAADFQNKHQVDMKHL